MTATKTELQVFIGTAAGFWRAIGELANVERKHGGDDLQRQAFGAGKTLQRTLDVAIRDWNDMGTSEYPQISPCASQAHCVPWNNDACEIFTVASWHDGYCPACSAAKAAYEAQEAARG